MTWTKPLQIVVQVRQVNQAEARMIFVLNPFAGFGDPAGGCIRRPLRSGDAGRRSPKSGKGKFPEILFYLRPHGKWRGINTEHLAAIGGIDRPGSNGVVGARIHVVPPEKFGAGESRIARSQILPDLA